MNKTDIIIKYFRNLREDVGPSMPSMNTGTQNGAPGFSSYAKEPNTGIDPPLGRIDGRSRVMKRLSKYYRELYNKTKKKNK